MDTRRGTSISVKMILTTTALILVIVTLFGVINYSLMSSVYAEQAQLLDETFFKAITQRGNVQARDLVHASRVAILQSDYTTLAQFVPDVAHGDPEVVYAFVADKDGTVLAHSDRANNGQKVSNAVDRDALA